LYWSYYSAKVYWDLELNVPVLRRTDTAIRIKCTPPCDVRPALGLDIRFLRELIRDYFKDSKDADKFLPLDSRVILLNKIPYPDLAHEVIVDGHIVGHEFYDLLHKEWRFKPLYAGISKMLEHRIGFYAITSLSKLSRNFIVHKGDIIEKNLPERKREFVALSTKDGKYNALGTLIRGGRIRVLKAWRSRKFPRPEKIGSMYEVIKTNSEFVREDVARSIKFLKNLSKDYVSDKRIILSFSGGKDSMATLLICKNAIEDFYILFNDTGIELPKTLEYTYRVVDEFDFKLILASAGDKFFKSLKTFGPPARDYRWCCKVIKLGPIAKVIKEKFGNNTVLSIVGQRKYESLARARSPRVWRNKWLPNLVITSPILDWTALEVWIYLLMNKVKVNPLYLKGFDRLGCWLCPASELAELELVRENYPQMWSSWSEYLRTWSRNRNLPREWRDYALWRWLSMPGDIRRLFNKKVLEKLKRDDRGRGLKVHIKSKIPKIIASVRVNEMADFNILIEYLKPIGIVEKKENEINIYNSIGKVKLYRDLSIGVEYYRDLKEGMSLLENVLKAILRYLKCVLCGFCSVFCPNNAVKIHGDRVYVEEDLCTHCLKCINICPVVEYLTISMDNEVRAL